MTPDDSTPREALALEFIFREPDGSMTGLYIGSLRRRGPDEPPHRPADSRKGWLDVEVGDLVVLCFPRLKREVRRVAEVVLHSSRPNDYGTSLPVVVSGRHWEETGTVLPRREPPPPFRVDWPHDLTVHRR